MVDMVSIVQKAKRVTAKDGREARNASKRIRSRILERRHTIVLEMVVDGVGGSVGDGGVRGRGRY